MAFARRSMQVVGGSSSFGFLTLSSSAAYLLRALLYLNDLEA